jgi:hypothetical protein
MIAQKLTTGLYSEGLKKIPFLKNLDTEIF